jgi:hypothetical protein
MRRHLGALLGALARDWPRGGPWRAALGHLRKVTRSYWAGLFWCYDDPQIPRTNNDLEHLFGAYRYHERRASGRKGAAPATAARGAARVVAATATRIHPVTGRELPPADLDAWRTLRRQLADRRGARTLGRRFRRRPLAYLRDLERLLGVKSGLPA